MSIRKPSDIPDLVADFQACRGVETEAGNRVLMWTDGESDAVIAKANRPLIDFLSRSIAFLPNPGGTVLEGTGFSTPKVYVNGVEAYVYASSATDIDFAWPDLPPGTYSIRVVNGDGLWSERADLVTYVDATVTIDSFVPASAEEGNVVTINGSGFAYFDLEEGITVQLERGGTYTYAAGTRVSNSKVTFVIPAVAAEGAYSVSLSGFRPDGENIYVTAPVALSVTKPPPPALATLDLDLVDTGGGQPVALSGTFLDGATFCAVRRAAAPSGYGIKFAGSQAYFVSAWSGSYATARTRFRLDSAPSNTFKIIAGTGNGSGGTGWLVCFSDVIGGAAAGQLVVYAGTGSGSLTLIARKFMMPSDIGKTFVVHLVYEAGKLWAYLDGKRINEGVAAASLVAGSLMNIGGRSDGTFSSDVTVLDVAEGTTALTAAQVFQDAASSVPTFPGQTHRYVASASVGATWNDEVGTAHLTRFGSPTVASFSPAYGEHVGAVEVWGDSIAAGRQSGGGLGDGWRREFQRLMSSIYGQAVTLRGKSPSTSSTLDYDYYTTASGGESLSTRLSTMVADLNVYAPNDCATILAYGINDIVALNRTAAQLQADVATAVGYINTARPGKPILVQNVMSVATGSATPTQHAQIASYQANFPSMIATLQATYPNVIGVDCTGVVTNPNDPSQLYDGVHPAPVVYSAMATVYAKAAAGARILANTATSLSFRTPERLAGAYNVTVTTTYGTSNALNIETWNWSRVPGITDVQDYRSKVTTTIGNKITQWLGQTSVGSSRYSVQGTDAKRPVLASNGLTFPVGTILYPNISYNGGLGTFATANGQAESRSASVFVVADWTDTKSTPSAAGAYNVPMALVTRESHQAFGASAGSLKLWCLSGSSVTYNPVTPLNDGKTRLLGFYHGLDAAEIYVGGAMVASGAGSSPWSYIGLRIGNDYGELDQWPGTIKAVFAVDGRVSAGDRDRLSRWCKASYGAVS